MSDSLGDSLGSLGVSVGSLGDSDGSLGDWLGSLGDPPGSPGLLGDSIGLPGPPVGLGSEGIWVGRAGIGDMESSAASSMARGLDGADSAADGGASLPGTWLYGSLCDGVEEDFSNGETGEIRLTPDSSPTA